MPQQTRSPFSSLSEALFRSSVVAFSSRFWNLSLVDDGTIPDGPCFLYGNHSNNYDPFMINAFTRWGDSTAGVMTMEYMKDHPLAQFFSSVGIVGTQKHVPEPGLIRRIYRLLEDGRSVVIYPEGGRRWDGRPAPWIKTTAKLFIKAGVPVYPIVTTGSYVGWPRWARFPRRANIELRILPSVVFNEGETFEESLARLKQPISFDENDVPERIRPPKAKSPAIGIDRLLYRDPETGISGGVKVVGGNRIESESKAVNGRVLPDSTILLDSTGERILTGDIYKRIKALPYNRSAGLPYLEAACQITGIINEIPIRERHGQLQFYRDRIAVGRSTLLNIPLEQIRFVSTERSAKLSIHLSNGTVSAHFGNEGSVLQWYNELHATAPNIRV